MKNSHLKYDSKWYQDKPQSPESPYDWIHQIQNDNTTIKPPCSIITCLVKNSLMKSEKIPKGPKYIMITIYQRECPIKNKNAHWNKYEPYQPIVDHQLNVSTAIKDKNIPNSTFRYSLGSKPITR